jgi:putative transposase
MADPLRTELVFDAEGIAPFTRKPAPGLVHHSDRGSRPGQYTPTSSENRFACPAGWP